MEESLLYQQFLVGVDESEGWLNERITLVSSEEVGDTLAAVQVGKFSRLPLSLVMCYCWWYRVY